MLRYQLSTLFPLLLLATFYLSHSQDSTQPIKPVIDTRIYQYLQLPNQMKVMLISDPNAKLSAAALQLNIGSTSDPPNLPGLANLLQHLLFRGSTKYPELEQFFTFVSSNSGYNNAYTDLQLTNYFFEIPSASFQEALDMFSHFFIDPLLSPNITQEEIRVIDSEFEMGLQIEGMGTYHAFQLAANQSSPFAKFFTGNLETLSTIPSQQGIDITQAVIEFFNAYYSANLMSLVLMGNHPISTLESWATQMFGPVKNTEVPVPVIDLSGTFPDLPKMISYVPVGQTNFLHLLFPIPHRPTDFETKPEAYLGSQILYNGEGSLYRILYDNGWIKEMDFSKYLQNEKTDFYAVYYGMTAEGLQHVFEIIQLTFSLIDKVRTEGITQERYDEIRKSEEIQFNYFPSTLQPADQASTLANNLQKYGPENILTGASLVSRFDSQAIQEFMAGLNVNNCLIAVASPLLQYDAGSTAPIVFDTTQNQFIFNNVNQHNDLYRLDYAEVPLPLEALSALQEGNSSGKLTLSPPNPFIPQAFTLLNPEVTYINASLAPEKVVSKPNLELWHSQFNLQGSPIVQAYFDLSYPKALELLETQASFYVTFKAVSKRIDSISSQIKDAGYIVTLTFYQGRISLAISGFRDKFVEVCSTVFSQFKDLKLGEDEYNSSSEGAVQEITIGLYDALYNTAIKNIRRFVANHSFFSEDVLQMIGNLTYQGFLEQVSTLQDSFSLSGVVIGNIDQTAVQNISMSIEENFVFADQESTRITQTYADLKGKSIVFRDWSPFNDSTDQCTVNYYTFQERTPESMAALSIITSILDPYLFANLRSAQQLGYVVSAVMESQLPIVGDMTVVQGSTQDPLGFDREIEEILRDFERYLSSMTEEKFQSVIENYENQVLSIQRDLGQVGRKWMTEVRERRYEFDWDEKAIEYVRGMDIAGLVGVYQKTFRDGGKFSYQIYSRSQGDQLLPQTVLGPDEGYGQRQEILITGKKDLEGDYTEVGSGGETIN